MCEEPLQVALVIGGVGDRQIAVGVQAVGEQVIQYPTVLAAQHAVLRPVDRDLRDVVGEQPLQQLERPGTRGFDLAHVRHVEDPARFAHRHVLLTDAYILDGHLPAGELHQLRARGDVIVVERGAAHARSIAVRSRTCDL